MIAEDREKLSDVLPGPGLRVREHPAADQGRPRQAHDQPDVRGRARQARLLRAHQHPRQLEDARQGDPPRDEDLRGRAVQQHEPRDLASAASWRSASSRTSSSRPSAAAPTSSSRSTSRSPSGRPARSRSAPASRRSRTSSPRRRSRQNNLFGRGQTLALQAQISSLRQLFLLRFVEPYFLDTQWTFAFDLYNQSRGFGTFYRNASGGTLTWGYPASNAGVRDVRAFLTYKLEDVSITTGSGGFANLGATSAPIAATQRREPVPRRRDVVAARLAVVGLAQQPPVPDRAAGTTRSSPSTRASTPARRTSSSAGAASPATTGRCGDRSSSRSTPSSASRPSTDPLGVPISERYLVGGIYNIRGYAPLLARSQAAHAAARRRRPAARQPAARRQHADHLEQRGRVPAVQEGRHLGRRVLRHGQRVQPRGPLLLGPAAQELLDLDQVRPVLPVPGVAHRRASASRSASASAGSRRSARCGSSGASRSTRKPAKIRWFSSSRSATSSEANCVGRTVEVVV